jgi:hypothetical protein
MRSTHTCQEIFQKMDRWIVEHRQARAFRAPGAAAQAARRRALAACLWRGRWSRWLGSLVACSRCSCMRGVSPRGRAPSDTAGQAAAASWRRGSAAGAPGRPRARTARRRRARARNPRGARDGGAAGARDGGSARAQDPRRSRLKRMVPDVGSFFTPLRLTDAFREYDEFFALSRRRYVPPNFAELRHVLNIAQAGPPPWFAACMSRVPVWLW